MNIFDLFSGDFSVLGVLMVVGAFIYVLTRISALEERIDALSGQEKKTVPLVASNPVLVEEPILPKHNVTTDEKKKVGSNTEWEQRFGSRAFTIVGGVAVLFGVGFFLRYAFENDLISPPLRIACGVVFGILFLSIGGWLSKKFASYGQALMGLGLGVLYLSSYASLHIYHLVGLFGASVAMILVTLVGLVLAIYLNSEALAVFALLGGFLTPVLLSVGVAYSFFFFIHLLLLDLAILAFSIARPWPLITLFGLLGTAASFLWWYDQFSSQMPWYTAVIFITVFFALFAIAGLVRYFKRRVEKDRYNLIVSALNPLLYVGAMYALVPSDFSKLEGAWVALLGAAYLWITLGIDHTQAYNRRYRDVLAVVGGALLVVAAPIALDGLTLNMAWSALMAALCVWSYRFGSRPLAFLAQCIGMIVFFNCVGFHAEANTLSTPVLNGRVGTYLFAIAAILLSAFLHWKKNAPASEYRTLAFTVDLFKAYILSWVLIATEIYAFFNGYWTPICMAVIVVLMGWLACRMGSVFMRGVVYLSYLVLAVQCVILSGEIQNQAPVLNLRILAGGALLLSAALFQSIERGKFWGTIRRSEQNNAPGVLFVFSHLFGLWLLSSEISFIFSQQIDQIGKGVETTSGRLALHAMERIMQSVGYTFYALALLSFGIIKKTALARQCAIVLFGFVVLKVFLYDSSALNNYYRFVSFLTLGILLLLSGYFYNRFRDRIRKFVTAA